MTEELKWGCGVSDDPQRFAAFMAAAPEEECDRALTSLFNACGRKTAPWIDEQFEAGMQHYRARFGYLWAPF